MHNFSQIRLTIYLKSFSWTLFRLSTLCVIRKLLIPNAWFKFAYIYIWSQGSKLGGAGSPGCPWILLRLPQISAGSPNMYCLMYNSTFYTFIKLMKMLFGSPPPPKKKRKILISSPGSTEIVLNPCYMYMYWVILCYYKIVLFVWTGKCSYTVSCFRIVIPARYPAGQLVTAKQWAVSQFWRGCDLIPDPFSPLSLSLKPVVVPVARLILALSLDTWYP